MQCVALINNTEVTCHVFFDKGWYNFVVLTLVFKTYLFLVLIKLRSSLQ